MRRFRSSRAERGYVLIGLIVAVTLMLIALAAVAPRISTQIKRDKEEELVHRGKQYVRAIQLYYRKFGRFPANVEQLENTNNLRFLRKRFPDPITGKDEWRLIRFGQAKPKPIPAWQKGAKGGGSVTPAAALAAGAAASGAGGATTSSAGASPTSGTSPGSSGTSSAPGSGSSSPTGSSTSTSGSTGIVNAEDISKPLSGSNSSFGGLPIVGVSSTSEKTGLKEIDGKTKYNEWEFVYDPTRDPAMTGAANLQGGASNLNQQSSGPVRPGSAPSSLTPTQPTTPTPSPSPTSTGPN